MAVERYSLNLACSVAALILAAGLAMPAIAATGEILNDDALADAEPAALASEARLFARIKDGVMLSLAECELSDSCAPIIDIREVEQILLKIDNRITTLSSRYAESNNKKLEEALLLYAEAREGYVEALDRLESLTAEETSAPAADEEAPEDDFSELFEDIDEEL